MRYPMCVSSLYCCTERLCNVRTFELCSPSDATALCWNWHIERTNCFRLLDAVQSTPIYAVAVLHVNLYKINRHRPFYDKSHKCHPTSSTRIYSIFTAATSLFLSFENEWILRSAQPFAGQFFSSDANANCSHPQIILCYGDASHCDNSRTHLHVVHSLLTAATQYAANGTKSLHTFETRVWPWPWRYILLMSNNNFQTNSFNHHI